MTTTWVPTSTRSNRSVMSWLSMRMQPYEANLPTDSGLLVPWMAYLPPDSVMAAMPIGLLGVARPCVRSEEALPHSSWRQGSIGTGRHQTDKSLACSCSGCGPVLIRREAAGKPCGDETFVRNGFQAAGSLCLAAPNQLLILDKSVLSATDMAGVARPSTAPTLLLPVSSSRALAGRPMASAPSSTARPSSNEKWRAVCQAM